MILKQHVGCLVVNVVGGSYGPIFQREVERLIRNNGEVWTSNRLKSIWTASLHLKNGRPELAKLVYQDNSISYHKGTMIPKGPFGFAVKQFLKANRPSTLRKWASLLRFYTGMVLKEARGKDLDKIRSSISDPGPVVPIRIREGFREAVRSFLKRKPGPSKGQVWSRSDSWESHYAQSLKGSSRYFSPVKCPSILRDRYYGSFVHSLLTTHAYPSAVMHRVKTLEPEAWEELRLLDDGSEPIGKISLVFEAGCKVRAVAQPNGWVQLAFRPLHSILGQLQRSLPESCVEDQETGVQVALNRAEEGFQLFSVDLSSATDRLPRSLQKVLLDELGLADYSSALEEVSSRKWLMPDGSLVSYSVGQPMGVYGSFPLLNITNIFIGRMACNWCGWYKDYESHFRVLGDDIIFFSRGPAEVYQQIMADIGVKVSPTKTFAGRVGQFAGFVILPSRTGYTAFRPYKHPAGRELTNPISFLSSLGLSLRKVSPTWEKLVRAYLKTASSRNLGLSPIVLGESPEAHLESIDERWASSLYRMAEIVEEPAHIRDVHSVVFKDRPGSSAEPLFHEQRMWKMLGHGPNMGTNRSMETEPMRQGQNLVSDPLLREGLKGLEADLRKWRSRSHTRYRTDPVTGVRVKYSVRNARTDTRGDR